MSVVIPLALILLIAGLIIWADAQDKRFKRREQMGLTPLQTRERVGIDYSMRSWPRGDDLNGVDDRGEMPYEPSWETDPYERYGR